MKLEYSGREEIPAAREVVWAFITDPGSIASCMPDLVSWKPIDARTFDATVQIAVGPVRGKFTFHITLAPDPGGERMGMTISGGGLGSVVDLVATCDVSSADGVTVLVWKGTATMRGPVAAVGGRVIDAQAKRVITTTFENVKARITAAAPVAGG
jgi:hypothetical protein